MKTDIVSLDPGGTTGIVTVHEDGRLEDTQLGPEKHHLDLWFFLVGMGPSVVVCEQFNYQRRELDKGVSLVLVSKEYIGVAELYCQMYERQLVMQNASEAKDFCDDRKMEKWGLDLPHARRHAKDAYRHTIYYDIFRRGNKSWLHRLR